MKLRTLGAALLLASAACARKPTFVQYRSPLGYTVEVPSDWPLEADPIPDRKPTTHVTFVGSADPQFEGVPLGAVLIVSRAVRLSKDVPAASLKKYESSFLAPTRAFFGDDLPSPATKPYRREYNENSGPFHGNTVVPMIVEGTVYRTADAYYAVEFRAAREKFERNRYALDRARETFVPPAR